MAASGDSEDSTPIRMLERRMSLRPADRFYTRVGKIMTKFETNQVETNIDRNRETETRRKMLKRADQTSDSLSSRSFKTPSIQTKPIPAPPTIFHDLDSTKAKEYISAYIDSTPFLQNLSELKETDRLLHRKLTSLMNKLGNLVSLLDYNFEIVDSLPSEYLLHQLLQNIVFPDKGALIELLDKLRAKSRLSCALCGCTCSKNTAFKQDVPIKSTSKSPIRPYKKVSEESSKVYAIDLVSLNQNRQCAKCANFYLTAKKDDRFVCKLCEEGCASNFLPKQMCFTVCIQAVKPASNSPFKSFSSNNLKSKNSRLQDFKDARIASDAEFNLEVDCNNKKYSLSGNSQYICKFILPKSVVNIQHPEDKAVSPHFRRGTIAYKHSPNRITLPLDPMDKNNTEDDRLRSLMNSRATIQTGYGSESSIIKPFDMHSKRDASPKHNKILDKMQEIMQSDPSLPCFQVMIQTKNIKEKGKLLHKELSNLLEEHLLLYEGIDRNPDSIDSTTEKAIGDYSRVIRNLLRGTMNFLPEHACGFEKCYKGLVLLIEKLLSLVHAYKQQIKDLSDYESSILQSEHRYKLRIEEFEKEISSMKDAYEMKIFKLQRVLKNKEETIELYRIELENNSKDETSELVQSLLVPQPSAGLYRRMVTKLGGKKTSIVIDSQIESSF